MPALATNNIQFARDKGLKDTRTPDLTIVREILMPVKVIYKNRRADMDRRKHFSTHDDPERRSGVDRRKLDQKLKHLIEANAKDKNRKKPKPLQKSPGNVIIRRKGKKDRPLSE